MPGGNRIVDVRGTECLVRRQPKFRPFHIWKEDVTLSISTIRKAFVPGNNSVRSIPFKAHKIDEFSPEILETHYEEFYGTAIHRLNILEREIYQVDASVIDNEIFAKKKEQEAQLVNDVLLHEVYFNSLGESGGDKLENTPLKEAIIAAFSSVDKWRDEFLQLASILDGKGGWIVLAWSDCLGRLLNMVLLASKRPAATAAVGQKPPLFDFKNGLKGG